MNDLKSNIGYAESFSTYWMSYCAIASFCSVFMLDNGYTNTEIGILIALGNLLSIVVQPIAATIADKSKRINVFEISIAVSAIVAIAEVFTFFLKGKSWTLFIAYVIMIGFQASLQPLLNSMAGKLAFRNVNVDYGICRAMGSFGYSVVSAVLSVLVIRVGVSSLPWVGELSLVSLIIGLLYLNKVYGKDKSLYTSDKNVKSCDNTVDEYLSNDRNTISMGEFICRHKNFLVIMVGILFLFYDHQIINFFQLQIFQNIGGNSGHMGRYYSFMTILELFPMFAFTWICRNFSSEILLKISTVGLLLRALVMVIAKTPLAMMLTLVVHPIGFPLFLLAIVKFINEIMDEGEAVRGQSLYVIMVTISALLASATGGAIIDTMGATTLLWICLITAIIGGAIMLPFIRRAKEETQI